MSEGMEERGENWRESGEEQEASCSHIQHTNTESPPTKVSKRMTTKCERDYRIGHSAAAARSCWVGAKQFGCKRRLVFLLGASGAARTASPWKSTKCATLTGALRLLFAVCLLCVFPVLASDCSVNSPSSSPCCTLLAEPSNKPYQSTARSKVLFTYAPGTAVYFASPFGIVVRPWHRSLRLDRFASLILVVLHHL